MYKASIRLIHLAETRYVCSNCMLANERSFMRRWLAVDGSGGLMSGWWCCCFVGGSDIHTVVVVCGRFWLSDCKAGREVAGKRVMLLVVVFVFVRGLNVARRCSTRLEF